MAYHLDKINREGIQKVSKLLFKKHQLGTHFFKRGDPEFFNINNLYITTEIIIEPASLMIDFDGERNRLNKELTDINNEIDIINKRLSNPMYI